MKTTSPRLTVPGLKGIPWYSAWMVVGLVWGNLAYCDDIHNAARIGNIEKVQTLLNDDPALVFSTNDAGETPLLVAVIDNGGDSTIAKMVADGKRIIVDILLVNKADVNAKDKTGATALHRIAKQGGQERVAYELLKAGANVNAKNDAGETPLHQAALWDRKEIASLLIGNGADINARDNAGRTPLHVASGYCTEIVESLLLRDANVNARDSSGETPLHSAAQQGHAKVVGLLLAKGADINATNNFGFTPMQEALYEKKRDVAQLLANRSVEVAGFHFGSTLEQFKARFPNAVTLTNDGERENGVARFSAPVTNVDLASFAFIDGSLFDVELVYKGGTEARIGGWTTIMNKLVAKYGKADGDSKGIDDEKQTGSFVWSTLGPLIDFEKLVDDNGQGYLRVAFTQTDGLNKLKERQANKAQVGF